MRLWVDAHIGWYAALDEQLCALGLTQAMYIELAALRDLPMDYVIVQQDLGFAAAVVYVRPEDMDAIRLRRDWLEPPAFVPWPILRPEDLGLRCINYDGGTLHG